MKLAILDHDGSVLLSWPTVAEAHADLADKFAATHAPRKWQGRKRRKLAAGYRAYLLELQHETIRL